MKKRRRKRRSCKSKVSHRSEKDAKRAITNHLKRNFVFHEMRSYHCRFCGMWHIGRTKKVVYSRFKQLNSDKK